ncbi:MAG: polysaccharide biosynthesis/export family protein [Deltaproteobacteria bacterium]|nr:polysaccharide biosynthesis/export family protein [Deltaproteobacteria bacterium]
MRRTSTWLALWALGIACATPSQPPDQPIPEAGPMVLGAGDVVEVRVFREPDLAGVYRIGGDGNIEFPLIGKVPAMGRPPDEVAADMRTRLASGYLVDPQVSVFLREQNSAKIHVLGQVNKAGTFPFESGMTVIQAITNAGGFTKLAATNGVTVTRFTPSGEKQRFQVPVGDIGSGQAANFQLKPGDIVFVPEAIF